MTEPAPRRDTVSCHECGELLGTINGGAMHHAGATAGTRPAGIRVVSARPNVRVFVDGVMRRFEFYCPNCGSCGRTIAMDKIRGVIVHLSEPAETSC